MGERRMNDSISADVEHFHVVFDPKVSWRLYEALQPSSRSIISCLDLLSFGPLKPTNDISHWEEMRNVFWHKYFPDNISAPSLAVSEQTINDLESIFKSKKAVTLWLGKSLDDYLNLYWIAFLIAKSDNYENAPSLSAVAGTAAVNSLGELSDEEIISGDKNAESLSVSHWRYLAKAWQAVTSDKPEKMREIIEADPSADQNLSRGLTLLKRRYPSSRSGLNQFQQRILEAVQESGPAFEAIMSTLTSKYRFDDDPPKDLMVVSDLLLMSSQNTAHPLVEFSGNLEEESTVTFTLTSFAGAILRGEKNQIKENGIDMWVGGVNINSAQHAVWYCDSDASGIKKS